MSKELQSIVATMRADVDKIVALHMGGLSNDQIVNNLVEAAMKEALKAFGIDVESLDRPAGFYWHNSGFRPEGVLATDYLEARGRDGHFISTRRAIDVDWRNVDAWRRTSQPWIIHFGEETMPVSSSDRVDVKTNSGCILSDVIADAVDWKYIASYRVL